MKEVSTNKILLYNQETGKHESVAALRGESAYEAAVRLGYTTLTEEQWLKEYDTKRDASIAAIEAAGAAARDSIPDEYGSLVETVNSLSQEIASIANMGSTKGKSYLTWTMGRAEAGANNSLSWCAYSNMIPTDGTPYYFDSTKYKALMSFYDSETQEYASVITAWITESPITYTTGRPYAKINIALKASEGVIDLGDVANTTYAYKDTPSKLVESVNKANAALANRSDGYVAFGTDGSTRGQAVSIEGLLYAKVVNKDYQMSLYYYNANDVETNTPWVTEVDLTAYKNPTKIVIRRADNAAMPSGSANEAVIGTYLDGYATNKYVYNALGIAYVDCITGSDENDGITEYTAYATIQQAIDAGHKKILVREGIYPAGISLVNATGVQILINKSYSAFDAETTSDNPKIIIDCGNALANGVYINKCSDCVFEDIEVKNATGSGWFVNAAENATFRNCVVRDCPNGMGFEIWNTNAGFINCLAYNIGVMGRGEHKDGFNIHGTGTTNFVNCSAYNCEDDGISHHDACYGYVSGGEWYNCGKGGVCTPTHGAKVDVSGVYVHDCGYGIYAGNDDAALAKTFNISGCVTKNNANYDIYVTNNTANIWNCKYDTIQHSGVGANNIF